MRRSSRENFCNFKPHGLFSHPHLGWSLWLLWRQDWRQMFLYLAKRAGVIRLAPVWPCHMGPGQGRNTGLSLVRLHNSSSSLATVTCIRGPVQKVIIRRISLVSYVDILHSRYFILSTSRWISSNCFLYSVISSKKILLFPMKYLSLSIMLTLKYDQMRYSSVFTSSRSLKLKCATFGCDYIRPSTRKLYSFCSLISKKCWW